MGDRLGRDDWRWTMALFIFASFAESLAWGHFAAFTPLYLRELHVPASQIANWTGILGTLGFVLGLPLLPFWGAWAERFGRKPIIVRSSLVEGVIFAIAALAQNPYQLAVARFLGGFVMGNTGVMMAVQSEVTPREKLGLAIALVGSGSSVAMAVGPLLGGLVAAGPGLRAVFWMDSGATMLAAVLLMIFMRERPRQASRESVGRLAWTALGDVVRIPAIRQLFLVYFFVAMGTTAATPFLPIWIGEAYKLAPWPWPLSITLGVVFAAAGAAMVVGTPILGWLGDRRGFRFALRLSLLGTAAGSLAQALKAVLGIITAGRVGQGLFSGGVSANMTALLARVVPPERRSSVMNLSILPQQVAWFFGPLVGTLLTGLLTLHGMLWATAGLTVLAAVIALVGLGRVHETEAQAETA
jgi:DHA1 family multidrug resistance protein-like MFS transporter